MKIGIFSPYIDHLSGGEKYMLTLAECLSKNHSLDLFWDNHEDIERVKERFSIDLSRVSVVRNIFSPGFNKIKRLAKTSKYDIIIVLSDGSIPLSFSKKVILHFQSPMEWVRVNPLTKLKLNRISTFICNSFFTKKYIDKKFGVKSVVLYPPVALHPKKVKKENMILHVGRFMVHHIGTEDFKKQYFMVRMFKDLVDQGVKNWRFVLAVTVCDEDMEKFELFQKSVGDYPIEFLINKKNDELWKAYSQAKIYWHASGYGEDLKKHPEYAEHFGISTVEAMGAAAVPVVFNAGGQREIVKEGESGFLWEEKIEFQDKTLALIHERSLWKDMSEQAQLRAQDFAGSRFCKELKDIIEE